MGMYTQVRGFLFCGSFNDQIGSLNYGINVESKLEELKKIFNERKDIERAWVCDDTIYNKGSNGSEWLFIGSEHKNYDNSIDEWIQLLVSSINCEGRIEFQYETFEIGDKEKVLFIGKNGDITEGTYEIKTEGYSFG